MAWRCLKSDMQDGSLGDVIEWADVVGSRQAICRLAFARRSDNDVRPRRFQVVDKPKDSINVRPLIRFSASDHIIYASLVTQIASNIDRTLSRRSVYSHRWRHDNAGMWRPISAWIRMQKKARLKIASNSQLHLAKTDVVAFYESIDLDTLIADVDSLDIEGYDSGPLNTFLSGFQTDTHAWGLPQGPEVSGILANLYLRPVDNFLIQHKFSYLRFSDDIDIFGRDWNELRSVILGINQIMRSRRLSMSASKTRIYNAIEARHVIEDAEKNAIQYMIKIGDLRAGPEVRGFFDRAITQVVPSPRDIRFSLFRLGRMNDTHAVRWCLTNLEQYPHLAKEIFDYLFKFPALTPKISRFLIRLVRASTGLNIANLDRQIIRYFLAREMNHSRLRDLSREIVEDGGKETLLREYAARYIGRTARPGDGQQMIALFESETDTFLRRALLVAAYESKYCPPKLLKSLSADHTEVKWTARYLSQHPDVPLPKSEK